MGFGTQTSGAQRSSSGAPDPPEFGAFPLDHDRECGLAGAQYRECLQARRGVAPACRELAMAFLECRMQAGLMAPEGDMSKLGFRDRQQRQAEAEADGRPAPSVPESVSVVAEKHKRGFVPGMGLRDGDRHRGMKE
jgi:cytochrome c oxidase assembly protein subunit 19